jgi:hypothetical protein
VLLEQRDGENTHVTVYTFTRATELLLVLRARIWLLQSQVFVNTAESNEEVGDNARLREAKIAAAMLWLSLLITEEVGK